jgi:uncharacterized membrane protein
MKNNNFSEIFKKIFSSNSGISSKRVMGFACIVFAMILSIYAVILSSIIIYHNPIPNQVIITSINIHDSVLYAILQFLAAGTSLLGVTLFEKNKAPQMPNTTKKEDKEEV